MRRSAIACGLCAVMMLGGSVWGGSAWGAPRHGLRRGGARPGASRAAAPISEVTVYEYGGADIRYGSTGTSWTLRSNGTARRDSSEPGENMGVPPSHSSAQGTFNAPDFKHLVAYLESSRLLGLKVPPPGERDGGLSISVVRGGQARQIVIPALAPPSPATQAGWVALTLVRGITSATNWKNLPGPAASAGATTPLAARTEPSAPRGSTRDPGFS